MANDFFALPLDESVDTFEHMLQRAGFVHRQTCADQKENHEQESEYQELHRRRIGNRRLRKLRLDPERPQQRRDRAGEQAIEYLREPELLGHTAASSY